MNSVAIDGFKGFLTQVTNADDQDDFPPLTPAETQVKGRLVEEPPQPEALITCNDSPFLTRGCVGGIIAAGGTGKTYLMAQLGLIMAAGGKLGPLKAPVPLKVLLLPGEDPQSEVDRRLWRVGQGDFPDGFYATSVSGKIGPLMQLENGNPTMSEHYDWLSKTIENHTGLDVLMIDPKSRFYGLDENNNDHCTQWISCLEGLADRYKVTVLFSHHATKISSNTLHQNMARGGSALADGVRWLIGLTPMKEETGRKYGVDHKGYIELDLVKANYVPKLSRPLFFERTDQGVLHYRDLGSQYLDAMTQQLALLLKEYELEPTRRELRTEIGHEVCEKMKGFYRKFTKSRDVEQCVNHGIRKGWMEEVDAGTKQNPKCVIKVKCTAW